MRRQTSLALWVVSILCFAVSTRAQTPPNSYLELSAKELLDRHPTLRHNFAFNLQQDKLPEVLEKLGKNVEAFHQHLPNTASTEEIRQEFHSPAAARKETTRYQYLIVGNPKNTTSFDEYRTNETNVRVALSGAEKGFLLTSGFAALPLFFHPGNQAGMRFRYVGMTSKPTAFLVAFAQIPGITKLTHGFKPNPWTQVTVHFQGLIWVDANRYQILRIHTELLEVPEAIGLQRESSDIDFAAVSFPGAPQAYWLPREVRVTDPT